jgi:hypothetical protein
MTATGEPDPRGVAENPVWTGTFAAVWGGAASPLSSSLTAL